MPQYARFDPAVAAPSPVIGWYDTDMVVYPNLPDLSGMLALTTAQWSERVTGLWAVSGGALVAYVPPAPVPLPLTLAQQATAALAAGLAITSTGTPALNATYAVDDAAQSHIQAETIAVLLNGSFADGTATLVWPDMTGAVHTFASVAAFKVFAGTVAGYVAALFKVINGTLAVLPSATTTIP